MTCHVADRILGRRTYCMYTAKYKYTFPVSPYIRGTCMTLGGRCSWRICLTVPSESMLYIVILRARVNIRAIGRDWCNPSGYSIFYTSRTIAKRIPTPFIILIGFVIVFSDGGGCDGRGVVEITKNGNINEHSGTDDKLSSFFSVFFWFLPQPSSPYHCR